MRPSIEYHDMSTGPIQPIVEEPDNRRLPRSPAALQPDRAATGLGRD